MDGMGTIQKKVGTVQPDSPPGMEHHENKENNKPVIQMNPEIIINGVKNAVDESNQGKRVFNATELIERKVEEIPTLMEPVFPQVGLIGLTGSSDTGKSRFLRQLAVAVVLGDERYAGFRLNARHKRAIYVSTEDSDFDVAKWLNTENATRGIPPERFSGLDYIFDTTNLVKTLDQMITANPVDLVLIDTFGDLYGGNLNQANEVRAFLQQYSELAMKHGLLVIMLHHTGKRTESLAPSKHNVIGSQGFESKCRVVVELRNDLMDSTLKHFCITKGNHLPMNFKNESYVLRINPETVRFESTGERVPFDELKSGERVEKREDVKKLHNQGKTQREIAFTLGISQSTVHRYLAETKPGES